MTRQQASLPSSVDPDTRWTAGIVLIDAGRVVVIEYTRTITTLARSLLDTHDHVPASGPIVQIHTSDSLRVGNAIAETARARVWSRSSARDAWRPDSAAHQLHGPVVTACLDGIQLILGAPAEVFQLCVALNSTGDFIIDTHRIRDTASASIDKFPERQHNLMVRMIVDVGRAINIPVIDARPPIIPAL